MGRKGEWGGQEAEKRRKGEEKRKRENTKEEKGWESQGEIIFGVRRKGNVL